MLTEDQIFTKLREDWSDDRSVVLGFYRLYEILSNLEKVLYAAYGHVRKSKMPPLVQRITDRKIRLRGALGLLSETEARYKDNIIATKTSFVP